MNSAMGWKQGASVVFGPIESGMALLDTQRNIYYALDGIGPFLWGLLTTPMGEDEIVARVSATYDVDQAVVQDDVTQWLASMRELNLVQVVDGTGH
jgi:hypothetical protein